MAESLEEIATIDIKEELVESEAIHQVFYILFREG